jgi:F-type H+-transporting ATPase subunit b
MAAGDTTTATTEVPARKEGAGFPPFKTETFPSQIFWLAITFALLFVVLWRVASPRIAGVITARRNRIADDLAEAQKHRGDAETASAAYQTALAGARARAQALAEENRKGINDEIERAKNAADAKAQAEIARAENQITATRNAARGHIVQAAQDAAVQIVARLTGETVSPDDAAAAVRSATGS